MRRQQPRIAKTNYTSSSYRAPEPEPSPPQPTPQISFKEAITLITLRLGRLEVFMNEQQANPLRVTEGSVDKDMLLGLIQRIDALEKNHLSFRQDLHRLQQKPDFVLEKHPLIDNVLERLEALEAPVEPVNSPVETEASLEVTEVPTDISTEPEVPEVPTESVPEPEPSRVSSAFAAMMEQTLEEVKEEKPKKGKRKVKI